MDGVGGRRGRRGRTLVRAAGAAGLAAALLALSACSGGSGTSADGKGAKVALILKEFTNPYWITMEKAARTEAAKDGVSLHVTAGKSDDDTTSQITQIEDAVAAGDKGIIIALNGPAVNNALDQARKAGLVVVALDTPPIPASTADVTYATDNTAAGTLDGKWTAAKLGGGSADIAMLDDLANQVITVDIDRDHGFLNGLGIPVGNPEVNGAEPKSGHYSGGKGGTYRIACQLPTNGSETGGQSAMENCLTKDPGINVVYAINEPAAEGAAKAVKAAGKKGVTIVAIDGGCANLPFLASGAIAASAGQAPQTMAKDGVKAIAAYAKSGTKPHNQAGQDYYDTGTQLFTDAPQPGVASLKTAAASKVCWG